MVCRTKWMLTEIQIFNLISLYYWEEQKNNPVQSKPFFDGSACIGGVRFYSTNHASSHPHS